MKFSTKIFILMIVLLTISSCGRNKTVLSTGAKSAESTDKPEDYANYTVARINNCGQSELTAIKAFSLFPGENVVEQNQNLFSLNFSGWNHTTNGSTSEWTNLKLTASSYNFNGNSIPNSSCNNVNTLDIVLLKKIADWNQQHSNGFECNILAQDIQFGDVENVVFDLRINREKTNIPSVESIKTTYASDVNGADVAIMDEGKVNIGITLGDKTNLNASIIIQLDQKVLMDQWIRVTIPICKLSFYQEINYNRSPKTLADFKNVVINRLLIVGETKTGSVLRSFISAWRDATPETFKEMDLSFKKIELQLK